MKPKNKGQPKAAIYVRVSSLDQAKGASPDVQKKQCRALAESKGFTTHKIFYDAGISGKAMEKRSQLKALLAEAEQGKFEHVVIWSISRFGRNLKDLAENMMFLKEHGITIHALKEGIDSSNPYGKMVFQVLGAVSELESTMIAERTSSAREHLSASGTPAEGTIPFGRRWVFEKGKQKRSEGHWELDEEKVEILREIIDRYLQGENLVSLCREYRKKHPEVKGLRYRTLLAVFKKQLGPIWITKMGTHTIPALVDARTATRVQKQIKRNTIHGRHTKATFLFEPGALRCAECGNVLHKQAQKGNPKYRYYLHVNRDNDCRAGFASIKADFIEPLILRNAFENVADEQAFEEAVARSFPDVKDLSKLKKKVTTDEKYLKKLKAELAKLVDLAVQGTLSRKTIKAREIELYQEIGRVTTEFERDKSILANTPDLEKAEREAKLLRIALLDYFGNVPDAEGQTWLEEMSDEDKKRFLKSVFPVGEKDAEGKPYGVYISKDKEKNTWTIFVNAVLYAGHLRDILPRNSVLC